MPPEDLSATVVKSLSTSQNILPGYYRSKLFIVPVTTNALVAAAGPLLSLLERLSHSSGLPPINKMRENIEHELRAFHSRLKGKTYTEEFDALAYYLLCATIDELVGKNYLRLQGKPAEFQAFTPPVSDNIGPEERFFDIINYIKERPNQYLDLIEFAYYCLITGFEGKWYNQPDGRLKLDNLLEDLFQLIQQYRVNKPHHLFKASKKMDLPPKNFKRLFIACAISLGVLFSSYTLSYALLAKKAKAIEFEHTMIAKLSE